MKRIAQVLLLSTVFASTSWSLEALAADINLIANPSLEVGNASGAAPQDWFTGNWGTNQTTFTYPVTGIDGARAARVDITSYSSGDAKWYFADVPASAGQVFTFSDSYLSNVPTQVVVQFFLTNNTYSYLDIANLPAASAWQTASANFTAPAGTTALSVFHLIQTVGFLTTDKYSLTTGSTPPPTPVPPTAFTTGMVSLNFDDGWSTGYSVALPKLKSAGLKATYYIAPSLLGTPSYMTKNNMLALQSAGQEIGSHSKTHPFLTQISSSQMQDEILGSRTDLLNMGIKSVTTFAYPYGDYNDATQAVVKTAYQGARVSDIGFNLKSTDPYRIQIQSVEVNTSLAQIKSWIDQSAKNKTWLVLLFHQIDTRGGQYSITPNRFQSVIDYLVQKRTKVVTNAQGVSMLNP